MIKELAKYGNGTSFIEISHDVVDRDVNQVAFVSYGFKSNFYCFCKEEGTNSKSKINYVPLDEMIKACKDFDIKKGPVMGHIIQTHVDKGQIVVDEKDYNNLVRTRFICGLLLVVVSLAAIFSRTYRY